MQSLLCAEVYVTGPHQGYNQLELVPFFPRPGERGESEHVRLAHSPKKCGKVEVPQYSSPDS